MSLHLSVILFTGGGRRMCGRGYAWEGGMCVGVHVWQGGMCGSGCVWQGGHAWQGGMYAGETTTEVGGTHLLESILVLNIILLSEKVLIKRITLARLH